MLQDKQVNGTDALDQAGVKGGKHIALHSTLMETGIQAASSSIYGQLYRQVLLVDLCQSFACMTLSSLASLLFLLLTCYVAGKLKKEIKKKEKKKRTPICVDAKQQGQPSVFQSCFLIVCAVLPISRAQETA